MDLAETAPRDAANDASGPVTTPTAGCPMHAAAAQVAVDDAVIADETGERCPVDAASERAGPQERSIWDLRARRVLGLPADAPRQSLLGANNAFAKSMWISAARCLITYVALPLLGPVVGLTGAFGPVLGIVLSLVSMVAIFFSVRRFFAGDHPWRWGYSAIGGGVFILLLVQLFQDAHTLLS